jgi:hypothetical protein
MSILDDAIREHLALKRAHGADDAELKKLEDEAFGPPARPDEPDPFAEAPTEFMGASEGEAVKEALAEPPSGRRAPHIADLQEPPPPPVEEPMADTGPTTEERHAIAEQPTEMFDVEGTYEDAATEAEGPSDDELVDAELSEPRLAPVDPLAGIDGGVAEAAEAEVAEPEADAEPEPAAAEEDEPEDEFDEFFSEQRLSDELNQALEAPLPDEPGAPPTEEAAVVIDLDEDEDEEPEPAAAEEADLEEGEEDEGEEAGEGEETGEEDVLEGTPDFLEDAPEDDDLWFEQKPPKDFDFDD